MQAQQARSSAGLSLLQSLNIALGIWVLGSTYWLGLHVYRGARIANGMGAALIIGFAITQLALPRWRVWSWVGVLIGVFVAAAPFLFDFSVVTAGTISNVVCGILMALIAATGLLRR
ncbi:SPW repeat protein [Sphaerobacter sp.]|uniref:SPW repeat domain-containing protein n=1 Tax=Sphaerobacter sp. TaxID=2099654 RepID=UPI001D74FEC7|nr:SPW repeat protein [Sphaerobacter sp.]MBX5444624.1 SPW repeat protein [Sphaerobacter sp.]